MRLTHRHELKQKHNSNEHVQTRSMHRGSPCTVTTAATFAHHCASSTVVICAADHNSPSVPQHSSSSDSVNYDDATTAQRCPMTHAGMSSCSMAHIYSSAKAKNMPRQQIRPGNKHVRQQHQKLGTTAAYSRGRL